jgi:hypothetical protein
VAVRFRDPATGESLPAVATLATTHKRDGAAADGARPSVPLHSARMSDANGLDDRLYGRVRESFDDVPPELVKDLKALFLERRPIAPTTTRPAL